MRAFVFIFSLLIITNLWADEKASKVDLAIGNNEAPVSVIAYTSFTCHHCADFHLHTLPMIKAQFLDSGAAKLIIKPFTMDKLSLNAFKLLNALPEEKRELAMSKIFSMQAIWMNKSPEELGKLIGLSAEQVKEALSNEEVENALISTAFWAQKQYNVGATPAFLYGNELEEGAPTIEHFAEKIASLQTSH